MSQPTTHRSSLFKRAKNTLTVVGGLVIGVGVLLAMGSGRTPAQNATVVPDGTSALSMTLAQTTFSPTVSGLGTLMPSFEINVLSEVSGRVDWVHPELQSGRILDAGTLVVKIDDVDLALALSQSKSDLSIKEHQLKQKAIEQQTYQLTLSAAQDRLALTSKELERQKSLVEQGLMSNSGLDAQQTKLLSSQSEVANLQLSLSLLPTQIDILKSDIASAKSRVLQKERDLERSNIVVPKTGQVGSVSVVEGGFIGMASPLFSISSNDSYEVSAQISSKTYQQVFNTQSLPKTLSAHVEMTELNSDNILVATPERIENGLDATTRMMSVVVTLNNESEQLVKGAFAQVTLIAEPNPFWAIPRSAIYSDHVYMADTENHLRIVPINVDFYQGDYAILSSALPYGELITSSIFPAVEGMPMKLVADPLALEKLQNDLKARL